MRWIEQRPDTPGMETNQGKYDVVIVGAGICGLNALFVAAQHLGKGGRIALVDRRGQVGGMWTDTYDYVRLHQPHPFFTAGDIKWRWDKDPSHLATKPEVLDHMAYCLGVLKQRVTLDEYFGWSYVGHEEVGGAVRTTIERDGSQLLLESDKLAKALGFNVPTNEPLATSSPRVRSVSPDTCDVRAGDIATSADPVWVIGGGKTAMDTVLALVADQPGREVNLVAGSGTWFQRRDVIYPAERPWRGGVRGNDQALKLTARYDGTNEDGFHDAYEGGWAAKVTPTAANWKAGLLSDWELATIRDGLHQVVMDHYVDVVDEADSTSMVLKSGDEIPVLAGSWIVNCTGYIHKEQRAYEPYSSPSGKVLSISQRSTTLLFSSYAGYLMTHLLMRGKLHRAPLYELDWDMLDRATRSAMLIAYTVLVHNYAVLLDRLPPSVFLRNGLDPDHWYPAPRWILGALDFSLRHWRMRRRTRQALDRVQARYGVRCGPLGTFEPAATSVAAGVRN